MKIITKANKRGFKRNIIKLDEQINGFVKKIKNLILL